MIMMKEIFEAYDNCLMEGRFDDAAAEIKKILEEHKEEPKIYYWALKRFGDYVGYGVMKDYHQAIEVYQSIITDYEDEEDNLFDWCQLDIAQSYLNIALDAFQTFDEMKDMLEESEEETQNYLDMLVEKRNGFITSKSDNLFKDRM